MRSWWNDDSPKKPAPTATHLQPVWNATAKGSRFLEKPETAPKVPPATAARQRDLTFALPRKVMNTPDAMVVLAMKVVVPGSIGGMPGS